MNPHKSPLGELTEVKELPKVTQLVSGGRVECRIRNYLFLGPICGDGESSLHPCKVEEEL